MVIILEGIDGSGKTTLAKAMKDYFIESGFKARIIKESFTSKPGEKTKRIAKLKRLVNSKKDDIIIYDRATAVDDFVYRFLNDETKEVSELDSIKDEIFTLLKKPLILFLELSDQQELYNRLIERGDEYITPNDVSRIGYNYQSFFKELNSENVYLIDPSEENILRLIDQSIIPRYESMKEGEKNVS